jgi:coenzyme F420-reducing hydrogenase alpha subunit
MKQKRTITVDTLARVEGEGALRLTIEGDRVADAQLKIFEPPRFFEAFLRGRRFDEAPDITARICGICPVAYQLSAVTAIEDALGVQVDPPIAALRRLLYCGEWIQSHALHVYLLHAPDFLGYESGLAMAADHPGIVARGLEIKKIGNELMALLGGRPIHPVNVRVGGFYRVPTRGELEPLEERLARARDAARETVAWTASLTFPTFERPYGFVALRDPQGYPFMGGRIVSTTGLDIEASEYDSTFDEHHVAEPTSWVPWPATP